MSDSTSPLSPTWQLVTPRLVISHFLPTPEHADFIVELYNTPLFIAGEGDTGINTRDKAIDMINSFVAGQFAKNGHGPYLLSLHTGGDDNTTSPRVPVGSVSLMRGAYAAPDVGFALLPQHTGKGYAQEAGKAIMEYATRSKAEGGLGYVGVFGFTSAKNAKSKKVCESLGLKYRGDYCLKAFGGHPSAAYTMEGMDLDMTEYGIMEERLDAA